MARWAGWVAVAWALACGGATVRSQGASSLAARYPAHRFLVGEGMSRIGRAEAEAQAKARLAEQVRSEVVSLVEAVSGGEDGREFQRILSEARVRSDFHHAQLIRVTSEPERDPDGFFRAIAVLDRKEAVSVLMDEYRRESERFRLEVGRALRARGDAVRFTAPYRQAEGAFAVLTRYALKVRVIAGSGRYPDEFEVDRREFLRLEEARSEVLSGLRITILPGDIEPVSARARVREVLTSAVASLGVVTVAEEVCRSGYAIVPRARFECETSPDGVRCVLNLGGRVTDCATRSDVAALDLAEVASGVHSREADIARAQTLVALNTRDLAERLRESLKGVLPLP